MVDILVETTRVSGLENIKNTFVVKKGKQYAIETEGTEFTEVLASGDAVAVNKTVSNNIHDVFPILGISATATLAFCEMTMAMTSQGGYISPRHLELLAMKMTFPGQSIPVNRHGMAKTHGVLLRASFERTVDTFVNAGVHSDFDPCKGDLPEHRPWAGATLRDRLRQPIDDPTVIPEKRAAKKRSAVQEEDEEEFVGRRKKKKATVGEKRWKEADSSWNFTFDPRRKFRLFLMKTNAFVPMSPVAPAKTVEDEESPQSPSYSPGGMFALNTPPIDDEDSIECTTPPPEEEFEPETPPMSEEEDEDVEEEDGVSDETPSASSASSETTSPVPIVPEWEVLLASPVVTGIPWIIRMESPTMKKYQRG